MSFAIRRLILFGAICLPSGLFLPWRMGAAEPKIVIRYDITTPQKALPLWLAYLGERMVFHEKHKLPVPRAGKILPSFQEEVSARRAALGFYLTFKSDDPKIRDGYWESLAKVERGDFMNAYVWTFHRQAEWSAKNAPANLARFESWKKENLKKHQPQTYGWLESGNP